MWHFIFFVSLDLVNFFSLLPFYLFCRLESSFRSFSRPVLHAAARVVQEMGKSRAAAFAVGLQDIDEGAHINSFAENNDSYDQDLNETSEGSSFIIPPLFSFYTFICLQLISILSWKSLFVEMKEFL